MIYAPTSTEYDDLYEELCRLNLRKVNEYFDKNWHAMDIRQQWAAYFTNNFRNYLNRTTNRLESINQKLKKVVTKYGTLHNFLKETLDCIQSLGLERDQRTIRSIHRQPVYHGKETVDEHAYRTLLTSFALGKFVGEKSNIDNVVFIGEAENRFLYKSHQNARAVFSVDADGNACSCPFFKMMALPCRHLIFFRQERDMELYAPDLCHRRWHKANLPSNLIGDLSYIQKQNVMGQAEKFRKANEVSTHIAEILSEKSMPVFEIYMATLNDMAKLVAEDKIFAINELNDENNAENVQNIAENVPNNAENIQNNAENVHENAENDQNIDENVGNVRNNAEIPDVVLAAVAANAAEVVDAGDAAGVADANEALNGEQENGKYSFYIHIVVSCGYIFYLYRNID